LKEHNSCTKVRNLHDHQDANNTPVSDARFLGDHQGDRWRQGFGDRHLETTGAHLAAQGEDDTAGHRSGKNGVGDPDGQIQGCENRCSPASQSGDFDFQARDGAALAPRTGAAQVDLQAEGKARST